MRRGVDPVIWIDPAFFVGHGVFGAWICSFLATRTYHAPASLAAGAASLGNLQRMPCRHQPQPVPIERGTTCANGLTTFQNEYVMDIPVGGSHVRSLDTRYPLLHLGQIEIRTHIHAHAPNAAEFRVTSISITHPDSGTHIAFQAQRYDGEGDATPGDYCLHFIVVARVA